MPGTETRYFRVIGSAQALIEKAAAIVRSWLKGLGETQRLMKRSLVSLTRDASAP